MSPSRRRFRLLAVALSVLVLLPMVELGGRLVFRLGHDRFMPEAVHWMDLQPAGPRLLPNVHSEVYARINRRVVRLNVNSLGLRGPEPDPRRGRPRLVVLGDSIVFGPGLEEPETVPGALQSELPAVEIINGGVPGLGVREEVDLLAEIAPRLRPDAALIGFYLNDGQRSVFLDEGRVGFTRFMRSVTWLRRRSMVFNELWSRLIITGIIPAPKFSTGWIADYMGGKWKTDRAAYDRIIRLAADDFGAAWTDQPWPVIERELGRFKAFCDGRGIPFGIVIFPVAIQVQSPFDDRRPQERVQDICRRLGIPCLDLLPRLRARAAEKIYFDHCHFTPLGARMVAAELKPFIESSGLLPASGPAPKP